MVRQHHLNLRTMSNADPPAGCVLIAEDQVDLRANLAAFLRMEGFHVLEAADGREAWSLVQKSAPDVIISDMGMPEADGLWLLQQMREHPELGQIPLIFLTAWADRANVQKGLDMGAADYITKPFQIAQVLDSINRQLAKRKTGGTD